MNQSDPSHADKGVLHKPWEHAGLKVLSWGGIATAGLALMPVIFSQFPTTAAGGWAQTAIDNCTTGSPRGIAGSAYHLLKDMGLGESIVNGGWLTAGVSGGIAIGGLLLANYIDKRTEPGRFRWGAVIRWTALATSILIALPAILPALSMGLNFLGSWLGSKGLEGLATDIGTLGLKSAAAGVVGGGGASGAMTAAALAGIHALTCALPLGITGLFLGKKEEVVQPGPMPRLALPVMAHGRVMPVYPMQRVAV